MTDAFQIEELRPFEAVRSGKGRAWNVEDKNGKVISARWPSEEAASKIADALNGYGPGPGEPVGDQPARLFLEALWPKRGKPCHVRAFLQGFARYPVPQPHSGDDDEYIEFSCALRRLAYSMEQCATPEQYFGDENQ